jgi:hypothetical protein
VSSSPTRNPLRFATFASLYDNAAAAAGRGLSCAWGDTPEAERLGALRAESWAWVSAGLGSDSVTLLVRPSPAPLLSCSPSEAERLGALRAESWAWGDTPEAERLGALRAESWAWVSAGLGSDSVTLLVRPSPAPLLSCSPLRAELAKEPLQRRHRRNAQPPRCYRRVSTPPSAHHLPARASIWL